MTGKYQSNGFTIDVIVKAERRIIFSIIIVNSMILILRTNYLQGIVSRFRKSSSKKSLQKAYINLETCTGEQFKDCNKLCVSD